MKKYFVKILDGKIYEFEKIDQAEITYKVIYGQDSLDYIYLKKDEKGMWAIQAKANIPAYIYRIALKLNDAIEYSDDDG